MLNRSNRFARRCNVSDLRNSFPQPRRRSPARAWAAPCCPASSPSATRTVSYMCAHATSVSSLIARHIASLAKPPLSRRCRARRPGAECVSSRSTRARRRSQAHLLVTRAPAPFAFGACRREFLRECRTSRMSRAGPGRPTRVAMMHAARTRLLRERRPLPHCRKSPSSTTPIARTVSPQPSRS